MKHGPTQGQALPMTEAEHAVSVQVGFVFLQFAVKPSADSREPFQGGLGRAFRDDQRDTGSFGRLAEETSGGARPSPAKERKYQTLPRRFA
jgi:hypothetical protein